MTNKSNGNSKKDGFFESVWQIVEQIPYGKVLSYGQIAQLLGAPRSARQVGWAMHSCPDNLPWQRVVKSDGTVAGGMFADQRRAILQGEGVSFLSDGRVDMNSCCCKNLPKLPKKRAFPDI